MKIGIAKFDAGVRRDFEPMDGGPPVIEKGRVYRLPDRYDFDHKAKDASGKAVSATIFRRASKEEVQKALKALKVTKDNDGLPEEDKDKEE